MKNLLIQGQEVAPECCIVCGNPKPKTLRDNEGTWSYISGSLPLGALTCSRQCLDKALERHYKTGRVDTPDMRMHH